MTKKIGPKREAQLSHKLIVLSMLMLDTLDELGWSDEEKVTSLLEELVKNAYTAGNLSDTVYLGNLANKVDTVIRKNYEKQ